MAWGLEARVPFLDKDFLEVAMNVNPEEKMFNKGGEQEFDADGCPKMEKVSAPVQHSLHEPTLTPACSTSSAKRSTVRPTARYAPTLSLFQSTPVSPVLQPYLPRSILWRQKEQFSDGVGYSWIDG